MVLQCVSVRRQMEMKSALEVRQEITTLRFNVFCERNTERGEKEQEVEEWGRQTERERLNELEDRD